MNLIFPWKLYDQIKKKTWYAILYNYNSVSQYDLKYIKFKFNR